jgi:hypothetical protein
MFSFFIEKKKIQPLTEYGYDRMNLLSTVKEKKVEIESRSHHSIHTRRRRLQYLFHFGLLPTNKKQKQKPKKLGASIFPPTPPP